MPARLSSLTALVAALRDKLGEIRQDARSVVSTGALALDRLLPDSGLRRGALAEYLGHGASLAFAAARAACHDGPLIVVDRERQLYPPAWGIDLSQTVLLRPGNQADELWALDQSLRCPGVGAVVVQCAQLDSRDFRRLQLAAECGGTVGLLVRPVQHRGQPSWADVQWLVEPQPSPDRFRLRVELTRCRGGGAGRSVILELGDHHTWQEADDANPVYPPAELAAAMPARRQSRA